MKKSTASKMLLAATSGALSLLLTVTPAAAASQQTWGQTQSKQQTKTVQAQKAKVKVKTKPAKVKPRKTKATKPIIKTKKRPTATAAAPVAATAAISVAAPTVATAREAHNTIIMIGWRPFEQQYAQLANNNVALTYRTKERTAQEAQSKLDLWDSMGNRYYVLTASSDWSSYAPGGACNNLPSTYIDPTQRAAMDQRNGSNGLYVHELIAVHASCNGWNWSAAANSINWTYINMAVLTAKAQGKKVIWSEPAQGWEALNQNPTYQTLSQQWKGTLVPMFATNFHTDTFDHVPAARSGAVAAANHLGSPVGESVQSWYFRESSTPLTTQSTVQLANMGREVGATYYQIEGTYEDMNWGTTYMNGIKAFADSLQ